MQWLNTSQLIPYLLPSDYHTSTQKNDFNLHFAALFFPLAASVYLFLSPAVELWYEGVWEMMASDADGSVLGDQ